MAKSPTASPLKASTPSSRSQARRLTIVRAPPPIAADASTTWTMGSAAAPRASSRVSRRGSPSTTTAPGRWTRWRPRAQHAPMRKAAPAAVPAATSGSPMSRRRGSWPLGERSAASAGSGSTTSSSKATGVRQQRGHGRAARLDVALAMQQQRQDRPGLLGRPQPRGRTLPVLDRVANAPVLAVPERLPAVPIRAERGVREARLVGVLRVDERAVVVDVVDRPEPLERQAVVMGLQAELRVLVDLGEADALVEAAEPMTARPIEQQEIAGGLVPVGRLGIETAQQVARRLETIPGHPVARHLPIEIEPRGPVERARHQRAAGEAGDDLAAQEHVAVGGQDPVARGAPDAGILGEELHELQARVLLVPRVPGTAHDPGPVPPRQPLAEAVDERGPSIGRVPLDQREAVRHTGLGQAIVVERRHRQHALVEVLAAVVVVPAAQDDLELAQRRRVGDRLRRETARLGRRDDAVPQQRRGDLVRRWTEGPRHLRSGRRHVRQVAEDGESRTVGTAGRRLLARQRPARIGNRRTGIARRQLVGDARDVGEMDGVVQDDDARLQAPARGPSRRARWPRCARRR